MRFSFIFLTLLVQSMFLENPFAQNLVGYKFSKANKNTAFPLQLNPFSTDGCTKYDDGTPENPTLWLHCCIDHDMAYWLGGTKLERKQVDQKFYQCIKDTGEPATARIMYLGTRAGGGPLGHNTYRWGFGWNRIRDYGVLTEKEMELAYAMYGKGLQDLKNGIKENNFPVVVPESYDYVSPFPYSFCEEQIINYLSPKLTRSATVTKFRDYEVGSNYHINIGLDICDETIEFQFSSKTNYGTCQKDYAYSNIVNRIQNVEISDKCLEKLELSSEFTRSNTF